jgi:hypothetical protein
MVTVDFTLMLVSRVSESRGVKRFQKIGGVVGRGSASEKLGVKGGSSVRHKFFHQKSTFIKPHFIKIVLHLINQNTLLC